MDPERGFGSDRSKDPKPIHFCGPRTRHDPLDLKKIETYPKNKGGLSRGPIRSWTRDHL